MYPSSINFDINENNTIKDFVDKMPKKIAVSEFKYVCPEYISDDMTTAR